MSPGRPAMHHTTEKKKEKRKKSKQACVTCVYVSPCTSRTSLARPHVGPAGDGQARAYGAGLAGAMGPHPPGHHQLLLFTRPFSFLHFLLGGAVPQEPEPYVLLGAFCIGRDSFLVLIKLSVSPISANNTHPTFIPPRISPFIHFLHHGHNCSYQRSAREDPQLPA